MGVRTSLDLLYILCFVKRLSCSVISQWSHSGSLTRLILGLWPVWHWVKFVFENPLLIYFGYNSIVSIEGQVRDWVERGVRVLLYTKYLIANGRMASIHPCWSFWDWGLGSRSQVIWPRKGSICRLKVPLCRRAGVECLSNLKRKGTRRLKRKRGDEPETERNQEADSARQEDHYWDYSTTNWWPGDYSASSTTDIDWPVESLAAGKIEKEVELGSVLVCKHP